MKGINHRKEPTLGNVFTAKSIHLKRIANSTTHSLNYFVLLQGGKGWKQKVLDSYGGEET